MSIATIFGWALFKTDTLEKHPIIQRLANHASLIIQKYFPLDKKQTINYTQEENYVVNSLLSIGEVETTFQQLDQALYFLTNFRTTKALKQKGITRFDHIIYHIESHLFRATGILDRLLIHVNIIFKLGLSPKECKSHNLLISQKGIEGKYSKKIKEADITLYNYLLDLMNLVDKYRKIRNQISHQERYNSETLKNVEMFNILQSTQREYDEFDIDRYSTFIKNEFDKVVRIYKNEMLDFNQKVRCLLDVIYPQLEKKWIAEYKK